MRYSNRKRNSIFKTIKLIPEHAQNVVFHDFQREIIFHAQFAVSLHNFKNVSRTGFVENGRVPHCRAGNKNSCSSCFLLEFVNIWPWLYLAASSICENGNCQRFGNFSDPRRATRVSLIGLFSNLLSCCQLSCDSYLFINNIYFNPTLDRSVFCLPWIAKAAMPVFSILLANSTVCSSVFRHLILPNY